MRKICIAFILGILASGSLYGMMLKKKNSRRSSLGSECLTNRNNDEPDRAATDFNRSSMRSRWESDDEYDEESSEQSVNKHIHLIELLLLTAVQENNKDVVRYVFDTHVVTKKMRTKVIYLASLCGHAELVKYLIDQGCKVNAKMKNGWLPIHAASQEGHIDVIKVLLEENDEDYNLVSVQADEWTTPLHLAAQAGHSDVVQFLIDNGAAINCGMKDGWTPLHVACCAYKQKGDDYVLMVDDERHKIIALLVEKKANIDARSIHDVRPLHIASYLGDAVSVKFLMKKNADTKARMKDNRTPLLLAAQEGHNGVIRLVCNTGTAKACTIDGFTALHLAAQGGHLEDVQFLVKKKFD